MESWQVIGKRIPKTDSSAKSLGLTRFVDDYSMPGMLYGGILRSTCPAARIISVHTEAAKRLAGVHAVILANDVPTNNLRARFGQGTDIGPQFEGLYRVLAEGEVRYYGEPIALVAAESPEIARRACQLITVDLEPLIGVFDPLQAMQPESRQVGEKPNNIASHFKIRKGNVEQAFALSDRVVEGTYQVPYQDHAYLEPESGLAWVDETGTINIRTASQVIEHFREVAEVLALPHSKVHYIGTWIGGGFGGKEDISVETYIALLAWKTRKPVKLTYSRVESLLYHSKRHPFYMNYKTGASRDGKLLAVQALLISDCGAYSALSPWVLLYATVNATGPYQIPNIHIDSYAVMTNTPITSAFRGFGAPQVNFAYESQMEKLAQALRMNPLELRKRNYLRQGETLSTGWVYERPIPLTELAERAWQGLGPEKPPVYGWKTGRGLAVGMCSYGRLTFLHDTARSFIKLELDGSAIVRCGVPDVGGGQGHILVQIASEELGIPIERIKLHITDSQLTPLAGTTTATRQLLMSGNATLKAARELKQRLLAKAENLLGVDAGDLRIIEGRVELKSNPQESKSLVEVIDRMSTDGEELSAEAQYNAPFTDIPASEILQGQTHPDFTFGAYAVEVEADEETGQVQIGKIVAAFDVGKALNPTIVEGQIEGGCVQGIGYALFENMTIRCGVIQTSSLAEYVIPTSVDVPDIQIILLESGSGMGPYGAKGIGEPPMVGIAPALVSAIEDAVGVRIADLPVTPEKIRMALARKTGGER
jgi:CO/xanthine dehydrogenase Mo-binding subunit